MTPQGAERKPEHEELCSVLEQERSATLSAVLARLLEQAEAAIRELSAEVDLANEAEVLSRKHGFAWKERAERAEAELAKVKATRAGKLLLKGKPFVVVAQDEPYYGEVYNTIRQHEIAKCRWTEEDEAAYRAV